MKRINKFIASMAALAIIATSSLYPVQASELSDNLENEATITAEIQGIEDAAIAEYEAKAAIQYEATHAYAALSATFGVTDDGATIYPDDYAGAWIDGADLHVALTSLDASATAKYDEIFNGFDCVMYEEAEYSLNELQEIEDSIFKVLSENYEVTAYYTEVDTNKIIIEAANDLAAVEDEIDELMNAPQTFLANLENVPPIDADLFVIKQGDHIESQASLIGGMKIVAGSSSANVYTIGVCGTIKNGSNTYSGIITAGHKMALSGSQQTIYRDSKEFGKTTLLMYKENGNGDWAAVRKTNNDTLSNLIYGSSDAYTRTITATKDDLAKGTYVMKYGCYGGYCTGTVEAQDVTQADETYTIKGLTRCSLDSGSSQGGDSGGPYYTQNTGNSYNFVGVHKGSSGSGNSKKIYFTPYIRFKTYFTVKTS